MKILSYQILYKVIDVDASHKNEDGFVAVFFFLIPSCVLVFDTKLFKHCFRWWKIAVYEHHLAFMHFNSPIIMEKSILLK